MTEPKPEAAPVPQPVTAPPTTVVVRDDEPSRSTRDILLIIAAIGAAIGNVVLIGGGIYVNSKMEAAKEQAVRVATESDKKLDVIHEQTNSNLTGVNDRLEKAYNKIEVLEELLIEEKKPKETDPVEENEP